MFYTFIYSLVLYEIPNYIFRIIKSNNTCSVYPVYSKSDIMNTLRSKFIKVIFDCAFSLKTYKINVLAP